MMKPISLFIALFIVSACSSGASQRENSAEHYCHQKGGELKAEKSLFGKTEYCLLPDGTQIEHWRLYLKDHLLP